MTTRYKYLVGESYATEWTIHPLLFEDDRRIERIKGMNDLVNAVEKVHEGVDEVAEELSS